MKCHRRTWRYRLNNSAFINIDTNLYLKIVLFCLMIKSFAWSFLIIWFIIFCFEFHWIKTLHVQSVVGANVKKKTGNKKVWFFVWGAPQNTEHCLCDQVAGLQDTPHINQRILSPSTSPHWSPLGTWGHTTSLQQDNYNF